MQCSTVKKLDYWGRCRVLKFLSQGTGLIHFFENVFEQELVLLEKERSEGCSHECFNFHKLMKYLQLCPYYIIVYLACSRSAVGGSSKHSCFSVVFEEKQ